MEPQEVYTATEAATFLRLHEDADKATAKIKRLARDKKIGHIRAGRSFLFRHEHLTKYLEDNEVTETVDPNPWRLANRSLRNRRSA